ncbi:bifunctional hydroxymethylpyrimidine kinase/phosphomethylpyrimidine kinase [Profundibacterium mesophilum]|nr:bifunctional hydroxymethylpyrimidine kinase/phosphomethylpyrimidine kinase [Profundibacterium mesophilum]
MPRARTALTIAGSDSGGGAGIQADLKTFSARGVFGTSAITAITAQNTQGVQAVSVVSPAMITAQIGSVLGDIPPDAIKIGMLADVPVIDAVADALADYRGPLVLDPVMVAKSGDALLAATARESLRTRLLPLAALLTPNLPEAACLLGTGEAASVEEAERQGRALLRLGPRAVLMKGGHGSGPDCVDLLVTSETSLRFTAPRIETPHTHGTGCTLSSAIAAELALGHDLVAAIGRAHDWLHHAIRAGAGLGIGRGHGPVHHFHGIWG